MKKEINKYIKKSKSYGEISLFREIQRYLSLKYTCTFISETHQHYVLFDSKSTKCKKVKKELSDLWIIAYSNKQRRAKMTFLQAKLEKKPVKHTPFKFSGDYFQYDLLSKRPKINDITFKFPKYILANAISDSVGSFGIFYFDKSSKLDFAYSTASDIICKNKAQCKTKTRTFYFQGQGKNLKRFYFSPACLFELRETCNADCFEYSLINLLIGTPIERDNQTILFLKNYFKQFDSSVPAISDFIYFLSNINDSTINNENESNGNPNILLINIDQVNERPATNPA